MKTTVVDNLTLEEKGKVLDMLIAEIDRIHEGYGKPIGSYQLLEMIDGYVIRLGYKKCPCCGRGA